MISHLYTCEFIFIFIFFAADIFIYGLGVSIFCKLHSVCCFVQGRASTRHIPLAE